MSRRLSSEDVAELLGLIHALCDRCIADEDKDRLRRWLHESEEAGWIYVQYMNLHAGLHWDIAQEPQLEPPASSATPILGFLGECFRQAGSFFSRPSVFAILLAIGLPGLMLLVLTASLVNQSPHNHGPVATIARACDSVGSLGGGYEPLSAGMELTAGQRMTLRSGVVEIGYKNGAQVLIEAPAAFEIRQDNGGFLQVGRLTATIPPKAHGFSVETPLATVIDHGTDFGVCVAAGGTAEAHVFSGRIEVAAKTMPENPAPLVRELTADQAVRILADTNRVARIEEIPACADGFVRSFPVSLASTPPNARDIAKQAIQSVTRHGGASDDRVPIGLFDGERSPLSSNESGLRPGTLFYSDRTYVVATIDPALVGAEYIRTFNSDKVDDGDCSYGVTLARDRNEVFLMVLLDDRFEQYANQGQEVVDSIVSRFARPGEFVDTGCCLTIEGEGSKNPRYRAFGKMAPTKDAAGKPMVYDFGALPSGILQPEQYGNYIIAVLPAPPRMQNIPAANADTGANERHREL